MGIPAELWTSFCPFRVLRMPTVMAHLRLYGRWQRYGILPDQDERTLHAFDVITASLKMPRVHDDDEDANG